MMLSKLCLVPSPKNNVAALVCTASNRSFSQDIRALGNPDTAFLKRGTGGRSSFNGNVTTVFGASGFIGGYVCTKLGKVGTQLIIPHRSDCDDYRLKRLRLTGDLGQVLFMPFHLTDPQSIRKAIKYSNAVINLIGTDTESRNFSYYAVHVKGAAEIAKACKEMNVERLIHFSALNVTEHPEKYYMKKLQFLPTKLKGEEAVMKEFPNATIFRPAAVFGMQDRFIKPLCRISRTSFGSIPLYAGGEKTIRQPVFAEDVAQGVYNALADHTTKGKIYQAVGPERFYLKDIAIFCSQILQRHVRGKTLVHDVKYDPLFFIKSALLVKVLEAFWSSPVRDVHFEIIERESVTDVVDPTLPTLMDLGVALSKLEDKVPSFILKKYITSPHVIRSYNMYMPADSLSAKAVNTFGF